MCGGGLFKNNQIDHNWSLQPTPFTMQVLMQINTLAWRDFSAFACHVSCQLSSPPPQLSASVPKTVFPTRKAIFIYWMKGLEERILTLGLDNVLSAANSFISSQLNIFFHLCLNTCIPCVAQKQEIVFPKPLSMVCPSSQTFSGCSIHRA